jgi:delta11-fatty-acid desaturase
MPPRKLNPSSIIASSGELGTSAGTPPNLQSTTFLEKQDCFIALFGHWYDAQGFSHPGGPLALGLGRGRDATVLFIAYHALLATPALIAALARLRVTDGRLAAALDERYPGVRHQSSRYFDFSHAAAGLRLPVTSQPSYSVSASQTVSQAATTAEGPFETGEKAVALAATSPGDPFEADVKAAALAYLRTEAARRGVSLREAMKAPPERWLGIVLWGAAFVATLPALFAGYWPALFITPVVCWVWMASTAPEAVKIIFLIMFPCR